MYFQNWQNSPNPVLQVIYTQAMYLDLKGMLKSHPLGHFSNNWFVYELQDFSDDCYDP